MAVIAFIGLGQMGSPMASNLLKQGHQLSVFDVNPDAVQRLVEKGAQPASSPAQAVKGAEFVITMLPNGDLVRSVLFGEQGMFFTVRSHSAWRVAMLQKRPSGLPVGLLR